MKKKNDKKVKKKQAKTALKTALRWLDAWCCLNIETLQQLQHGWITVHPEYGIINHSTLGEVHLVGLNRFIKRSVIKHCLNTNVEECLKSVC